jgi:hypothetical protein
MLNKPKNLGHIVTMLENAGYHDLANTIHTGIDPIGRELDQDQYDAYLAEADEIELEERAK